MTTSSKNVKNLIKEFEKNQPIDDYESQMTPLSEKEIKKLKPLNINNSYTKAGYQERLSILSEGLNKKFKFINKSKVIEDHIELKGHIENYIGMAQVPIGISGPLLINGAFAKGEFYVPLATTEGALVASYNRGMKACFLSGGISAACLTELTQRSPLFKFDSIHTVAKFIVWVNKNIEEFKIIVGKVSRYAKLLDIKTNLEGNCTILTFEYSTGDASGQNMVTICTAAICKYILANFPIKPKEWYIESNYSGDKKATALSFTNVRGKKVACEIILKKEVIEDVLKSKAERIYAYWRSSTLAVIQTGALGAQSHVANGLTAIFIACGQDVACIAESSVGLTRMEIVGDGDLYVSLTLPSLVVGTVGGGTVLPTQKECLELMDCHGDKKAKKFAEICASLALAGEISIASAHSAGHYTSAHQKLGR